MSNTKHSPAPWAAYQTRHLFEITGKEGQLICDVYKMTGTDIEQNKANAKLITAAPELLAMLETLCTIMSKIKADEYCEPVLMEYFGKSVALIERVTGESFL